MGISPLPTIKDLVSLPGMFEVTDEFKKALRRRKTVPNTAARPTTSFRFSKRARK
jgi:hypothetical protein